VAKRLADRSGGEGRWSCGTACKALKTGKVSLGGVLEGNEGQLEARAVKIWGTVPGFAGGQQGCAVAALGADQDTGWWLHVTGQQMYSLRPLDGGLV
jgi:hypothetical protein